MRLPLNGVVNEPMSEVGLVCARFHGYDLTDRTVRQSLTLALQQVQGLKAFQIDDVLVAPGEPSRVSVRYVWRGTPLGSFSFIEFLEHQESVYLIDGLEEIPRPLTKKEMQELRDKGEITRTK